MPGDGPAAGPEIAETSDEISDLLPLRLARPRLIPPAPTRCEAAVDFLPDFGGASWVAYGAAHLLIVSHFPSPDSRHDDPLVGPFFQQAIESPLQDAPLAHVSAVAWCPTRPSEGELAAARGDCVWLYAPTPGDEPGSFCWRQTAVMLQFFIVKDIGWTGSGDGLIVAGIEVVLWIRKNTCWEAAWKSRAEVPQSLVSANWFAERPIATAAGICTEDFPPQSREESSCVLVHQQDGKSGITRVRLCHPRPVLMIQWRPHNLTCMKNNDSYPWRDVLLTCCLDGTVRLWSEVDNGRARRSSKDMYDQKNLSLSFHVIAVIEMNQCLKGTLGTDISIAWAIEFGGIISKSKGTGHVSLFEGNDHDKVGRCAWLISVGPMSLVAFWAIHCLDDISPLRFPRVMMWKNQDLKDFKKYTFCNPISSNFNDRPILVKAVVSRSWLFGPPVVCSLLQLLPNNTFCWSQLSNPTMSDLEVKSLSQSSKEKCLSCFTSAVLYQDGHTGKIVQLAVHPYSCEIELAASLDSNGFLLFWSLPTTYNCTLGMQMFVHPAWKLLGKIILQDLSPDVKYSCLKWVPLVLDEKCFLLLGNGDGVDCFMINISGKEGNIVCQKILMVSFSGQNHVGGPPDQIFATSIDSTSGPAFDRNGFFLFAIWMKKFQALSWKVLLCSENPSQSNSQCDFDAQNVPNMKKEGLVSSFTGRMYEAAADLVSSTFADSLDVCQVTSVAVVSFDNSALFTRAQQFMGSLNEASVKTFPYHLAMGCSDGTLKLWRISHSETTDNYDLEFHWELVGAFIAHQGPVSAVSLSNCGGRVATASMGVRNNITSLHIWESICLIGGGGFLLEDAMSFDEAVVGLSWLSIGNGQLLLGVCMPNELRVYSERSFTDKNPAKLSKSREMHIWCCIALSPLTCPVPQDFLWGPRAALVLVYEKHFSLFSPWSFRSQKKYHEGQTATTVDGADHSFSCAIYHARGPWDTKESVKDENVNENGCNASTLHLKMLQQQYEFDTKSGLYSMLDIADRLRGILPVYHPDALIQYLHTGKWKRAFLVLKHLVGYIKSTGISAVDLERNKSQKSFCGIPEVHLSAYFEENISRDLCSKGFQWGQDTANGASSLQYQQSLYQFAEGNSMTAMPENASTITPLKSEIMEFADVLEKSGDIVCMNDIDKNQITAIVKLLGEISDSCYTSTYESLDEPGRRFWVAVQFQRLYFFQKFGRFAAAEEFIVNSGLVALAFQSDCQDNLLSAISAAEPSWVEMRNLGVGFWYTNTTQLRARMEKLARSQYLKRKDPKDCALLYLALNRVQVLAGLFKVSKDEKDKVLFGFLSRNFQEEKNKAAALKNAYVLMGRHQLELAIAFFLLGGDMSSAVTVCAKNLGDEQLALVICRLLEGYGGPLERQLISNFLLPNAIGKRDYWLSSLLEWTLGNYSRSLKHLFDSHVECMIDQSATLCCRAAFSDPNIGQYCVILASKNCLRNLIGDFLATVVSKFGLLMTTKALNRCGLPLEALEYISSFSIEGRDQGSMFDIESHEIFHDFLNPFSHGGCNWLLGSVACHLELNVKSNMALLYIGKLLSYHPCHPHATFASFGEPTIHDEDVSCQEEVQIQEFNTNLNMTVSMFEQKYLLKSIDLAEMIVVFTCNKELQFLGYVWLQDYIHRDHDTDGHSVNSYVLNPAISSLVLKASKEISHMVARFVVSCSFTDTTLKLSSSGGLSLEKDRYNSRDFCLRSVVYSLRTLRPLFKLCKNGSFPEGLTCRTSDILVLLEYFIYFASTWFMGNLKGLIVMIYPILKNLANDRSTFEVIAGELMKLLRQNSDLIVHDASGDVTWRFSDSNPKEGQDGQSGSVVLSISDVEKWHLIKACLWMHFSSFAKHQLSKFLVTDRHENENGKMDLMNLFPMLLTRSLMASFTYVSSSLIHQLASYLRQKALKGLPVPALCWLEEASQSPTLLHSNHAVDSLGISGNEDIEFMLKILWEISVCPQEICTNFVYERINCFSCNGQTLPQSWQDIQKGMFSGHENSMSLSNERDGTINGSSPNDAAESLPRSGVFDTYNFIVTRGKDARLRRDIFPFHNPKEVFRRSGELVEAICFNSINEQQVALVSNRKGLLFFDLKIEELSRKNSEYIWSASDWPQDGWAGCESTSIPTFVSPGIGLESKSGVHLGLGGATRGLGLLARPGRDLTGGGAFGIPGYAGIGASGLGWGEQEEFKYMDLPATVENIRSRALSCHPLKPFFLVGSSNTHIYLWEFGKDRATATYGILPAANVSPPYALTSVSALQFDHCGQRFATAALDGTVCAWQLEVGGRSNVHPTESNLCFSNHAADVAYLATGGSILAAAGCSSNDVNVVVWDTLAPPDTSQASLVCHEGGARSLSVFDNDIGSSSISPLIVTGGKSGDVGLHDFRFIATGRSKHHRHSSNHDLKSFGVNDTTLGTFKSAENLNGMIWYIPKAHLGSITKISTIPNTCLFLTGSKDGDVKLWDAKRCELIFHWQKMHDRHTFLQPNSRGFSGVVRAAVTDIQVLSHGFLTCGGDGLVKLVSLR